MLDDREWQAQRIVGEQQTPFGLEHDVSVQKTLWPPRAALDTKSVWRYRGGQREAGSDQSSHEVVVAIADGGQPGDLVEDGFCESGRNHCLQALTPSQHTLH
jgi:hypothetical protein